YLNPADQARLRDAAHAARRKGDPSWLLVNGLHIEVNGYVFKTAPCEAVAAGHATLSAIQRRLTNSDVNDVIAPRLYFPRSRNFLLSKLVLEVDYLGAASASKGGSYSSEHIAETLHRFM